MSLFFNYLCPPIHVWYEWGLSLCFDAKLFLTSSSESLSSPIWSRTWQADCRMCKIQILFEPCNQEKHDYILTSVFSIFSSSSSSSVKSPSSNGASLLFLVWPRTLCNPSSLYFLFLSTSVPPPSWTLCEPMSLSAYFFEPPFNLSSLSK